jgi:pathogenesis-related protein 1
VALIGCAASGSTEIDYDAGPYDPAWLTTQNAVRASASPAPSPALPPFTWSSDAQSVAQQYASQCVYAHNPNRGNRGENIAYDSPAGFQDLANIVNLWASEASSYTYSTNSCASGADCGHYTQIVWRDTTKVGCGHQICTFNQPDHSHNAWDFWVCDYEPPGNVIGQKPY